VHDVNLTTCAGEMDVPDRPEQAVNSMLNAVTVKVYRGNCPEKKQLPVGSSRSLFGIHTKTGERVGPQAVSRVFAYEAEGSILFLWVHFVLSKEHPSFRHNKA